MGDDGLPIEEWLDPYMSALPPSGKSPGLPTQEASNGHPNAVSVSASTGSSREGGSPTKGGVPPSGGGGHKKGGSPPNPTVHAHQGGRSMGGRGQRGRGTYDARGGRGGGRVSYAQLPFKAPQGPPADMSQPRPVHATGAAPPSLPTRTSSAPPVDNLQIHEGIFRHYHRALGVGGGRFAGGGHPHAPGTGMPVGVQGPPRGPPPQQQPVPQASPQQQQPAQTPTSQQVPPAPPSPATTATPPASQPPHQQQQMPPVAIVPQATLATPFIHAPQVSGSGYVPVSQPPPPPPQGSQSANTGMGAKGQGGQQPQGSHMGVGGWQHQHQHQQHHLHSHHTPQQQPHPTQPHVPPVALDSSPMAHSGPRGPPLNAPPTHSYPPAPMRRSTYDGMGGPGARPTPPPSTYHGGPPNTRFAPQPYAPYPGPYYQAPPPYHASIPPGPRPPYSGPGGYVAPPMQQQPGGAGAMAPMYTPPPPQQHQPPQQQHQHQSPVAPPPPPQQPQAQPQQPQPQGQQRAPAPEKSRTKSILKITGVDGKEVKVDRAGGSRPGSAASSPLVKPASPALKPSSQASAMNPLDIGKPAPASVVIKPAEPKVTTSPQKAAEKPAVAKAEATEKAPGTAAIAEKAPVTAEKVPQATGGDAVSSEEVNDADEAGKRSSDSETKPTGDASPVVNHTDAVMDKKPTTAAETTSPAPAAVSEPATKGRDKSPTPGNGAPPQVTPPRSPTAVPTVPTATTVSAAESAKLLVPKAPSTGNAVKPSSKKDWKKLGQGREDEGDLLEAFRPATDKPKSPLRAQEEEQAPEEPTTDGPVEEEEEEASWEDKADASAAEQPATSTVPSDATSKAAPSDAALTPGTKAGPAGKIVYARAELLRLRVEALDPPAEFMGKLKVTSMGGQDGARKSAGSLSQMMNRTPSTNDMDSWQRGRQLPGMERAKSGTDSAAATARSSTTAPSTGGTWRRGEQPVTAKREQVYRERRGTGDLIEQVGLQRSKNAWVPVRDTSALEQCEAKVRGILNKMTWDTFDKLSQQLLSIEIDSKEMLSKIISLVFDKAVDEPNFGELYAELCVQVSKKSQDWTVIRAGQNLDAEGTWFWTDDISIEKEIVGPFTSREDALAAAVSDAEPNTQQRTQQLKLVELLISNERFIKVLETLEEPTAYYVVFRSLSEEGCRERLHGDFDSDLEAINEGRKATTFRKLLLKKCQEEFYKEHQPPELDQSKLASLPKEDRQRKVEEDTEMRFKAKRRMLGNIRFIGELYKKTMLKENIMHECVLKLMGYEEKGGRGGEARKLVKTHANDEENLEALCKLLTTVGKQLDDVKSSSGPKRSVPEHHDRDLAFYYERLRELSHDKKSGLASRARFMIRDLLDLREDKWVPRRAEAKATRTDEYKKELGEVKGPGPVKGPGMPPAGKGGSGAATAQHRNSLSGGGGPPQVVQRQPSNDARAPRGDPKASDKRPTRGPAPDARDRRGSSGTIRVGRHGASDSESSVDGVSGRGSSADGSEWMDVGPRGKPVPPVRGGGGGGGAAAQPPSQPPPADMPRDKVENMVETTIGEFLQLKDEDEAVASMDQVPRELGSEVAAQKMLGKICDCSDNDRPLLQQLLLLLLRSKRITTPHLKHEIRQLLELIDDLVVDVPNIYDHVATLVAALIKAQIIEYGWFQAEARNAQPREKEQSFIRLMSAVFKSIDNDKKAWLPWSYDHVFGAEVPFAVNPTADPNKWFEFVSEHQLWATYLLELSRQIVEEARGARGTPGTPGILAWYDSLDASLKSSPGFTRALAYRLLTECPKNPRGSCKPARDELQQLFKEICGRTKDPRVQTACLHGIQRFVFEVAQDVNARKGMMCELLEALIECGATVPGILSLWEQDLNDASPEKNPMSFAHNVVTDVMARLSPSG